MRDSDAELGGDEGAGQRRVHVADDEEPIWAMLHDDRFKSLQDVGRLAGMAAFAATEIDIRLGQPQVGEKRSRHVGVVMLAGMDDETIDPAARVEGRQERGDLHEIRPRSAGEHALEAALGRHDKLQWRIQDGSAGFETGSGGGGGRPSFLRMIS